MILLFISSDFYNDISNSGRPDQERSVVGRQRRFGSNSGLDKSFVSLPIQSPFSCSKSGSRFYSWSISGF